MSLNRKELERAVVETLKTCGKSTGQLAPLDNLSDGAIETILECDRLGFGMIADVYDNGRRFLALSKRDPNTGEFVPPRPSPKLLVKLARHRREIVGWICGKEVA